MPLALNTLEPFMRAPVSPSSPSTRPNQVRPTLAWTCIILFHETLGSLLAGLPYQPGPSLLSRAPGALEPATLSCLGAAALRVPPSPRLWVLSQPTPAL